MCNVEQRNLSRVWEFSALTILSNFITIGAVVSEKSAVTDRQGVEFNKVLY